MAIFELLGINLKVTAVVVAAFAILFFVLYKTLFKKIGAVLDEREAFVKNKFSEIESKEQNIALMVKEYEQKLKDIEKQALEKMQEAVKQGIATRDQIITNAKKDAEQELIKIKQILNTDKERIKLELKESGTKLVIEALQKIIPEVMDDNMHKKVLDKFNSNLHKVQVKETISR